MKTVAFFTLGCKVNQYDTEVMLASFKEAGYIMVDFAEVADVYIINTCTVTNMGDRKSRQVIRKAIHLNSSAIIGVVGCYAQRAVQEVLLIPGVSFVLGTKNHLKIVQITERSMNQKDAINGVEDITETESFESNIAIHTQEGNTRAFIKIQEGCNQFCTYCIIPYVRGSIRSRSRSNITDEVRRLALSGYREIVLTGIHLASYGKDNDQGTLLDVIKDIHNVEGIDRIRLGSIEPTLLTESFIKQVSLLNKVCQHYHVSLQSGSAEVLRRMNRSYTPTEYVNFINNLRKQIPGVSVTTDVMVGFPGETAEEYHESYTFIKAIAFSKIHVFRYSPREGTKAALFSMQVPDTIKEERSSKMIQLGKCLEYQYLSQYLHTTQNVLVEKQIERNHGIMEGYTNQYIRVTFKGESKLHNCMLPVTLLSIGKGMMMGKIYL